MNSNDIENPKETLYISNLNDKINENGKIRRDNNFRSKE